MNPLPSPARAGLAGFALITAFTLGGCGGDDAPAGAADPAAAATSGADSQPGAASPTDPTGIGATLSEDGKEASFTDDGRTYTVGGDLPEGFPADLPLIEGTLQNASRAAGAGPTRYSVVIRVDGAAADVARQVREQLTGAGYTVTEEHEMGPLTNLKLAKGRATVGVNIVPSGSAVQVVYLVAPTG